MSRYLCRHGGIPLDCPVCQRNRLATGCVNALLITFAAALLAYACVGEAHAADCQTVLVEPLHEPGAGRWVTVCHPPTNHLGIDLSAPGQPRIEPRRVPLAPMPEGPSEPRQGSLEALCAHLDRFPEKRVYRESFGCVPRQTR